MIFLRWWRLCSGSTFQSVSERVCSVLGPPWLRCARSFSQTASGFLPHSAPDSWSWDSKGFWRSQRKRNCAPPRTSRDIPWSYRTRLESTQSCNISVQFKLINLVPGLPYLISRMPSSDINGNKLCSRSILAATFCDLWLNLSTCSYSSITSANSFSGLRKANR